MAVITENPHAWFTAINDAGDEFEVENDETPEHNYPFAFEVNFSDTASPPINSITLYNMSKEHRNFYKKKKKCYLYFNWGDDKKIISEGYISKIATNQSDGVTESLVITFTEGTDYKNIEARKLRIKKEKKVSNYKTVKQKVAGKYIDKRVHYYSTDKNGKRVGHYKTERVFQKPQIKKKRIKTRVTKSYLTNKTFKKGKTCKFIINAIANQAGIKIAKIELAKNPKMKKAYTAKGKPLTLIKALVKKCNSKLTYARGKLEIINPKKKKRSWVVIDDASLMNPPTMNDDDSDGGTWEITTPLLPDVTVNVGIKMDSKYLKGKFYVSAGQHSSDGTRPQTQMSLKKAT